MTGEENEVRAIMNGGTMTVMLGGDMFIARPDELVLDLSQVCFMDSSGLGLILGRYSKATELGIGFRVVNPSAEIRRILDLAGTERLIIIDNTYRKGEKI